jgi:hypothetical protein
MNQSRDALLRVRVKGGGRFDHVLATMTARQEASQGRSDFRFPPPTESASILPWRLLNIESPLSDSGRSGLSDSGWNACAVAARKDDPRPSPTTANPGSKIHPPLPNTGKFPK